MGKEVLAKAARAAGFAMVPMDEAAPSVLDAGAGKPVATAVPQVDLRFAQGEQLAARRKPADDWSSWFSGWLVWRPAR